MTQPIEQAPHVAVVGQDAPLRELLAALLGDVGYVPHAYALTADAAADVSRTHPAVIVLEIGLHEAGLAFLDALRAQPATQALPVVVLGTSESRREQAHASGNVYAVLPMPFDVEELLQAVAGARTGSRFEATMHRLPLEAEAALRQAAEVLSRHERSIMLAWLLGIRQLAPFDDRADLSPRDFLDSLPRVLHALALVLRHEEPPVARVADPDLQARLREHARTRQEQALPAHAVVLEYQVLRQVITTHLRRALSPEAVLNALDDINDLLDQAMRTTVTEYERLGEMGRQP